VSPNADLGGHWNYRMFHRQVPDGLGGVTDEFTIREAYYDRKGRLSAWSAESASAHGETKWELMDDACAINRAISSPVVEITPDGNALAPTDSLTAP
jgi:hypothetical protein